MQAKYICSSPAACLLCLNIDFQSGLAETSPGDTRTRPFSGLIKHRMRVLADMAVFGVALLHLSFMVLEIFLWDKPIGQKILARISHQDHGSRRRIRVRKRRSGAKSVAIATVCVKSKLTDTKTSLNRDRHA
jgi:hypothetical protein